MHFFVRLREWHAACIVWSIGVTTAPPTLIRNQRVTPTLKAIAAGALLLGAPLLAAPAAASVIQIGAGNSGTVYLGKTIAGADLSATAVLTVSSVSATQVAISLALTNTTTLTQPGTNRLIAFGFDILPDGARTVSGATENDPDWKAKVNTGISGGVTVDVCVFAGPQTCQGGGNGGLGETIGDTILFTVTGQNLNASGLYLDNFTARYQAIGTTNTSGLIPEVSPPAPPGPSPQPASVPEPGTLALFGAGLAGLAGMLRRRRAA